MNYLNEPVQCLSNVLAHAQYSDCFEDVQYVDRNWETWRKLTPEEKANRLRMQYSVASAPCGGAKSPPVQVTIRS